MPIRIRLKLAAALLLAFTAGVSIACWSTRLYATEVTGVSTTPMLSAATTSGTTGTVIGPGFMPRCRESAVYVQWSAGVNAGAVVLESAHDPNYTGTWAPLVTVTQTGTSREDIIQVTGIHAAVRTRVGTGVTGGTVSTWMTCN